MWTHPPLMDVNWSHGTLPISEPGFVTCLACRCGAHSATDCTQEVATCGGSAVSTGKTAPPHSSRCLTDVTQSIDVSNLRLPYVD
jgi:hypothetical protein